MDLNYLHRREGIERLRAERAACPSSRAAHEGLADAFRARIEEERQVRRSVPAA